MLYGYPGIYECLLFFHSLYNGPSIYTNKDSKKSIFNSPQIEKYSEKIILENSWNQNLNFPMPSMHVIHSKELTHKCTCCNFWPPLWPSLPLQHPLFAHYSSQVSFLHCVVMDAAVVQILTIHELLLLLLPKQYSVMSVYSSFIFYWILQVIKIFKVHCNVWRSYTKYCKFI